MIRHLSVAVTVLSVVCVLQGRAAAQSFGVGPRFSFARGNVASGTPSSRLLGGTVRILTGPHLAVEGAMDYRSYSNDAGTERVHETPLQGSVLVFLTHTGLSPYVLGGVGVYTLTRDALSSSGLTLASTTNRKFGWHVGAGAEIRVARNTALFADYRYRFVTFGDSSSSNQTLLTPGRSVFPVVQDDKLSHEGSMWTSGVAFYF